MFMKKFNFKLLSEKEPGNIQRAQAKHLYQLILIGWET